MVDLVNNGWLYWKFKPKILL